jgi:hypothetical protein
MAAIAIRLWTLSFVLCAASALLFGPLLLLTTFGSRIMKLVIQNSEIDFQTSILAKCNNIVYLQSTKGWSIRSLKP